MDDVEKEIDDYAVHIEDYVNALKAEIKARTNLISLLVQADTQLESDRKDVKLVASVSEAGKHLFDVVDFAFLFLF